MISVHHSRTIARARSTTLLLCTSGSSHFAKPGSQVYWFSFLLWYLQPWVSLHSPPGQGAVSIDRLSLPRPQACGDTGWLLPLLATTSLPCQNRASYQRIPPVKCTLPSSFFICIKLITKYWNTLKGTIDSDLVPILYKLTGVLWGRKGD